MTTRADRLLPYFRRIGSSAGPLPDDSTLLSRFLGGRDPEAFETLVARHGPMVLRVCQRVLGDRHDAEDAFQATFLVLARKAASVRPAGALAAWLHGVACRMALGARLRGARRRRREAAAADRDPLDPRPDPLTELTAREALRILDEEVQRLPQAYRLPVILCCLEGLSQEEAARQLGWTPGSVKGRLERGRKRLHQRLAGRGLSLAVALALVEVARGAAADLAGVLAATAKAATAFAAGNTAGGCGVPPEVATLAAQGLRGMALKAKVALTATLLLGLVAAGAGMLARTAPAAKQSPPKREVVAPRSVLLEPEGKRPPTDRFGDPLPPGAVARVGTIRWWCGATDAQSRFRSFAYTPDGKHLVSCDVDNTVRFLDAITGKELRQIKLAGKGAALIALAPDGKRLVTADSRSLLLQIWETSTGRELRQLKGGQSCTEAVAFSPDGKLFAAATGITGIQLWDTATWKEIRRLTGENAGWNRFITFLPDGKTLISGDGAVIRWWEVGTGRVVRRLDREFPPGSGFYALAVSPDGQRLAVLVQKESLRLWDAATGNEVRRIALSRSRGGWCLCFSPDGRTLACGNGVGRRGNETLLFAADTGRELRRWDEDDRLTTNMAFSPDGKILAQARSGVIHRRDATTGKPIRPLSGLPSSVMAVRFSQGGKALIASCLGGRTGFWDPLTGKQLAPFQGPPKDFAHSRYYFQGTTLTADGRKTALADAKGDLYVWETATGKLCCRVAEPPPCGEDGAVFSADGKVLALGHRDSSLRLWDTATGKLLRSFPQIKRRFLRPLAFSPDGRILAIYFPSTTAFTEAKEILLWDTTTGKELSKVPWPEDTSPACLTFTADGQRLIVSYDPQWPEGAARERIGLCVWDLAGGRELFRMRGPAAAIALSPDEKTLAAASGRTIRLWELASGKERGRFSGHRERIRALAFSPDGRLLVSGSQDHTALVWDVTRRFPDGK